MKKEMYILGSIEIVLGVLIWCLTSILKELMPVIGYVAFQNAMKGSYAPDNYELSFGLPNMLAVILIIAGALQMIIGFINKNHQ